MAIFTTFNDGVEYLVNTETGTRTPVSQINGGDWDEGLTLVGDNLFEFTPAKTAVAVAEPVGTVSGELNNVVQFTPAVPIHIPTPDEHLGEIPGYEGYQPPTAMPSWTMPEVDEHLGDIPGFENYVPGTPFAELVQPPVYSDFEDTFPDFVNPAPFGAVEGPALPPTNLWDYGMTYPPFGWGEPEPEPEPEPDDDGGFSIFGWHPPSLDWHDIPVDPLNPFGPDLGDVGDGLDALGEPYLGVGAPVADWWERNKTLVLIGGIIIVGVVVLLALR